MLRNIFASLLSVRLKEYFLEATTSLTQGDKDADHFGRPLWFCTRLKSFLRAMVIGHTACQRTPGLTLHGLERQFETAQEPLPDHGVAAPC